jgi:hypothetical protein
MYPAKLDAMKGSRTGRLLRYDPSTEEATVLARNLFFANGISVDKDETFVLFAETFALRLVKYYLTGEKEGSMEYVVDGFPAPGYFDGVDCGWKGVTAETNLCYAVHPSLVVPLQKILNKIPHPIDQWLRNLILMLPKWLAPEITAYGGITVLDAESSKVVQLLQDPDGSDIAYLTGVTVFDNKLYLGSLRNDFVAVYDLS